LIPDRQERKKKKKRLASVDFLSKYEEASSLHLPFYLPFYISGEKREERKKKKSRPPSRASLAPQANSLLSHLSRARLEG